MKVLNPIYDTVFKFLMEDIEIAQGLISLITEEEVIELLPAPTEQTTIKIDIKYNQLPLQRLDYVAIIKTKNNNGQDIFQKVSIEVQKSPFVPELGRFRKYISEKYARQSEYKTNNEIQKNYLPLKTIYFIEKTFNKNLPIVLRRKGEYWDVLKQTKYDGEKDKYVELLNHDSWFIQIENLPPDLKNELMYILSVFAPWTRNDEDERYIDISENNEATKKYNLMTKIINRLYLAGKSREVEAALELEISLEKYIENAIENLEQERKQKELAQIREKEERKQKELAQIREEEERKQKELAQNKLLDVAKKLLKNGLPIEEVHNITNIPTEKLKEL